MIDIVWHTYQYVKPWLSVLRLINIPTTNQDICRPIGVSNSFCCRVNVEPTVTSSPPLEICAVLTYTVTVHHEGWLRECYLSWASHSKHKTHWQIETIHTLCITASPWRCLSRNTDSIQRIRMTFDDMYILKFLASSDSKIKTVQLKTASPPPLMSHWYIAVLNGSHFTMTISSQVSHNVMLDT